MITHAQLRAIHRQLSDSSGDILRAKGADYAPGTDALSAFKATASRLGMTEAEVLGVLMDKHYTAVLRYIADNELASESLYSRITDLINYLVFLYAMSMEWDDAANN